MIMFWNKREVYVGYDMKRFDKICSVLSRNRIKYTYKIINSNKLPGKSGVERSLRQGANLIYVYVHKNDCNDAYDLINKY